MFVGGRDSRGSGRRNGYTEYIKKSTDSYQTEQNPTFPTTKLVSLYPDVRRDEWLATEILIFVSIDILTPKYLSYLLSGFLRGSDGEGAQEQT